MGTRSNISSVAQRARPRAVAAPSHVNRNLLIAAAVLTTGGFAAWSVRTPSDVPAPGPDAAATRESGDPSPALPARSRSAPAVAPAGVRAGSAEYDPPFARYVDDKYRQLLRNVEVADAPALRAALLEREDLVAQINTAKQSSDAALRATLPALQARKAGMDRRLESMLPSRELGAFEALRDADIERFQVEDYAAGIAHVAPLAEPAKQALLATKLACRERFRRVLEQSRLMSGELDPVQRRLAFEEVRRALQDYQQGYLQEARQYLYDDAQYQSLANYETSEYNAELTKLRGIAGLR